MKRPALGTLDETNDLCGWAGSMKIPEVARRARRRLFWNEVLAQGTCAVERGTRCGSAAARPGNAVAGLALADPAARCDARASAFIARRSKLPGLYPAAQIVDRRLKLADSHFDRAYTSAEAPSRRSCGGRKCCRGNWRRRRRIADRVDVKQAIPFTLPRAVYTAAGAGLRRQQPVRAALRPGTAAGLRQPLASILENSFGGSQTRLASAQKKRDAGKRSPLQEAMGSRPRMASAKGRGELDAAPDSALETTGIPDTDNSKKGSSEGGSESKTPAGDPMEGEPGRGRCRRAGIKRGAGR